MGKIHAATASPPEGDVAPSRLEFLRTLYAEGAAGFLVLWRKCDRRSRWIEACRLEEATNLQDEEDVYFGVALQDQAKALELANTADTARTRGATDSTVALPGLWADIDVRGPAHSRNDLPPSFEAAHELIASFPLPPTIVVHSGHGLQAYWLFKEPWVFEEESERKEAETLSRRFQATLQGFAREEGWTIDNTSDLARVLRLPGTFNTKLGERRPVEVIGWYPGRRYDPSEFEPYLVDATKTSRAEASGDGGDPPSDLDAILQGCTWMQHCYDDRMELPEPEWYAALSIVGRSFRGDTDGRSLAHEWSDAYPGYSADETDRKLDQALKASGPRTCANIADQLGARERYCSVCPHFGEITSPIVLGRRTADQRRDERPARRIVIVGPDEKRVNDQALEALASHPELYYRGDLLVHVVRDEGPARRIHRPEGYPRIVAVPNALLREMLTESVDFRKVAGEDELVSVGPPASCVQALAARGHWPPLRPLEVITQTPLLLPDGSVLQEPGYDRATGFYFLPKVQFPEVPDHPTSSEVTAALDLLREAVCDFPFAQERHLSAFLAAVLTILARHAFSGPAPLLLVDANTRGSGKGLLVDVACRIGTGEDVARMAYSRNEEEQRKAILSLALEGRRVALIDNVAGSFGSATLDAALTATVWTDRILGVSKTATVPLTIVWFATGNNVAVVGDTVRRCLYIRLESPDEHPERRQGFRHPHLLEWIDTRRPELTAAGLTLLRAFVAAGRPDQRLPAWGSFEDWSDLVRNCLVWLGLPDPGETRRDLHDSASDEDSTLNDLVGGLSEVFQELDGGCGTAREILQVLESTPETQFGGLRDALAELVPRPAQKALPNTAQLGALLREYRGRVSRGRAIEHASQTKSKRGRLWCVAARQGDSGDGGDGGDGDSPHLSSRRATTSLEEENGNNRGEAPSPASPASPTPTDGGMQRWQI